MEAIQALLIKREAARLLSVSPRTVDYLRMHGKLPCVKIGTAVRFKADDVQAFIESQRRVTQ